MVVLQNIEGILMEQIKDSEEVEVVLPKLGESIYQAVIVKWLKKEGQPLKRDEPVVEVLTDKVASEIPSPINGVLKKQLKAENEECQVGEAIFVVQSPIKKSISQSPIFSPACIRIAKENGISMHELNGIKGTGEYRRVSKKDVLSFLEKNALLNDESIFQQLTKEGVFEVKMSAKRKETARAMQKSKREIPAAYFVTEVDVSEVLEKITRDRTSFYKKNGAKLTITSYIISAIAQMIEKYPHVNAKLKGDVIEVFEDVNLGVAVAVADTISVPVIEKCQEMDLGLIARRLTLLVEKARSGKLSEEEVGSGTITMTNFGMAQMKIGIPIIRPGEVAIIGVGVVEKKLVVKAGDNIKIRSMVNLSMAFDHRVIDGMYAGSFLNAVKLNLEEV